MTKKKGYQLLDVPNNKRGRKFFEDFQEFLNKDWYGYHRRGRLPKAGVKLNWQGQAQVEDSSRWAIYVRGVPVSKEFLEHSAAKRNDEIMKLYHKEFDARIEAQKKSDRLKKEFDYLNEWTYKETCNKDMMLNKYKISLFGWNISLWRDDKGGKSS